ncbi:hypothetical protein BDW68DRAFT_172946 [Aspergillus falconensis]
MSTSNTGPDSSSLKTALCTACTWTPATAKTLQLQITRPHHPLSRKLWRLGIGIIHFLRVRPDSQRPRPLVPNIRSTEYRVCEQQYIDPFLNARIGIAYSPTTQRGDITADSLLQLRSLSVEILRSVVYNGLFHESEKQRECWHNPFTRHGGPPLHSLVASDMEIWEEMAKSLQTTCPLPLGRVLDAAFW